MKNKIKNLIDATDGRVGFGHALQSKWFGTQWTMNGEDYSNLKWKNSNKIPKPTESELDVEVTRLQADYDAKKYQRDRQPEYPQIGEQLDMIYWDKKNGTKKWEEAIDKVKADHPKG